MVDESRERTPYVNIPDTVSAEARAYLAGLGDPAKRMPAPAPDDVEAWRARQTEAEVASEPLVARALEVFGVKTRERRLGGVPVIEVTPKGWTENGCRVVFLHGGGYVNLSARSTLASSGAMADATGMRVVSVDYTLAPHAKWRQAHDEVTRVVLALNAEGFGMERLAFTGDSAGGGMAVGQVLKLRDQGSGTPAAVVLWSPWSDITETGDTYETLRRADPQYLYGMILGPAAAAYADAAEQRHPWVSPVYGDYTRGFPPTLVQCGTKEIFLSNAVRQYRAIDAAGGTAVLDVYEGMPHVFQPQLALAGAPEAKVALGKCGEFVRRYLGGQA